MLVAAAALALQEEEVLLCSVLRVCLLPRQPVRCPAKWQRGNTAQGPPLRVAHGRGIAAGSAEAAGAPCRATPWALSAQRIAPLRAVRCPCCAASSCGSPAAAAPAGGQHWRAPRRRGCGGALPRGAVLRPAPPRRGFIAPLCTARGPCAAASSCVFTSSGCTCWPPWARAAPLAAERGASPARVRSCPWPWRQAPPGAQKSS